MLTNDLAARNAESGHIATLHRYWQSLNGGETPPRALVDPAAIVPLLPHVYIVEFDADPFRVRFRLVGTAADAWNGINLVGRCLDEFLPTDTYGANRILIDHYRQAWESGQPSFGSYQWRSRADYRTDVKFGLFPLTIGGKVAQAISIEEIEAAPIADEWVPQADPAKAP